MRSHSNAYRSNAGLAGLSAESRVAAAQADRCPSDSNENYVISSKPECTCCNTCGALAQTNDKDIADWSGTCANLVRNETYCTNYNTQALPGVTVGPCPPPASYLNYA